nr:hypothetical protein [uncultured Flavobacterium sp.]
MKKIIVLAVIILGVFASCKKTTTEELVPAAPKSAAAPEPSGDQCYISKVNNGIVELSFTVNSMQEVNGKLLYNLYEKDKNEGTIVGNIKGDTLIAEYTFMSEGVSSVREVAFLQKDGAFIEGFGDVIESNDKVVFKDRTKLKFDVENTMTRIDCKK